MRTPSPAEHREHAAALRRRARFEGLPFQAAAILALGAQAELGTARDQFRCLIADAQATGDFAAFTGPEAGAAFLAEALLLLEHQADRVAHLRARVVETLHDLQASQAAPAPEYDRLRAAILAPPAPPAGESPRR